MYHLHINARSYGRIFEVVPEEAETAELMVEEAVSYVLLDLFGEVMVDDVMKLRYPVPVVVAQPQGQPPASPPTEASS